MSCGCLPRLAPASIAVKRPCSPAGKAMMEHIQATKPYKGKQEQEQKQEQEHMKGHTILAA